MRRRIIAFLVAFIVALAGTVAAAAAVGAPAIEKASATFSLTATSTLSEIGCAGEDPSDQYGGFTGTWTGHETGFPTPTSSGDDLSGKLTYPATLLMNQTTSRGLMQGTATLKSQAVVGGGAPGVKLYSGPLTLIVENGQYGFVGRGWLDAKAYVKDAAGKLVVDGSILANVQVSIAITTLAPPTITLNGAFGDDPDIGEQAIVPDYSVATNDLTC